MTKEIYDYDDDKPTCFSDTVYHKKARAMHVRQFPRTRYEVDIDKSLFTWERYLPAMPTFGIKLNGEWEYPFKEMTYYDMLDADRKSGHKKDGLARKNREAFYVFEMVFYKWRGDYIREHGHPNASNPNSKLNRKPENAPEESTTKMYFTLDNQ